MKQVIDLSKFDNNDNSPFVVVLRRVLKQLKEDQPAETIENNKRVDMRYTNNTNIDAGVLEKLSKDKIISLSDWHEVGGFWHLSFKPKKLNKWIQNNLIQSKKVYSSQSLPSGGTWSEEEKEYILKLPEQEEIRLNKSYSYSYVLDICIKNHGRDVSHKEITEKRNYLNSARITTAVRAIEKLFNDKKIKKISIDNSAKGSCILQFH